MTDAALIAVWGYYEMAVDRVAEYLMRSRNLTLRRRDARGDFLDSAKRYFSGALGCELHKPNIDWERLRVIESLRHFIAHASGSLIDKSDDERQEILKKVSGTPGITTYPGRVAVSLAFVQEAFKFLRGLVTDLTARAKAQAGG